MSDLFTTLFVAHKNIADALRAINIYFEEMRLSKSREREKEERERKRKGNKGKGKVTLVSF